MGLGMRREVLTIANLSVEYFTEGHGKPLLVIPDELGSVPGQDYLAILARHRRVIAVSLPGFGGSELAPWMDCVDDLSYIVLELLDRLNLPAVDVIGCSFGGWVAAELASKVPERIDRLVLSAPYGVKLGPVNRLEFPDIFAMSRASLAARLFHDPAHADIDASGISDDDATTMVRGRESFVLFAWEPYLHNPKLSHRLGRATCPTLFIRGESDGIVSGPYLEGYARLMPSAVTAEIPGAGHFAQIEQPEAFVARAIAFLDNNDISLNRNRSRDSR